MVRLVTVTVPSLETARTLQVLEEAPHVHSLSLFPGEGCVSLTFKTKDMRVQNIVYMLERAGVGIDFGTIDVAPLVSTKPPLQAAVRLTEDMMGSGLAGVLGGGGAADGRSADMTSPIQDSRRQGAVKKKRAYRVSERMTVEEIADIIDSQSHLTFDYLAMTFVAAVIAATGLISNSATSVVASMLVSPLMGPILCITFGFAVGDPHMRRRGMRNELIGVAICFAVGLIAGACVAPFFGAGGIQGGWASHNLRSEQIEERGNTYSLLTGFIVAVVSGVGVTLAITGGGINALVGVAISASLLPPIVCAGVCTSLALIYSSADRNEYHYYSPIAVVSTLLFIINIVVIIAVGFLTFRLKRVSPETVKKPTQQWHYSHHAHRSSLLDKSSRSGLLYRSTSGRRPSAAAILANGGAGAGLMQEPLITGGGYQDMGSASEHAGAMATTTQNPMTSGARSIEEMTAVIESDDDEASRSVHSMHMHQLREAASVRASTGSVPGASESKQAEESNGPDRQSASSATVSRASAAASSAVDTPPPPLPTGSPGIAFGGEGGSPVPQYRHEGGQNLYHRPLEQIRAERAASAGHLVPPHDDPCADLEDTRAPRSSSVGVFSRASAQTQGVLSTSGSVSAATAEPAATAEADVEVVVDDEDDEDLDMGTFHGSSVPVNTILRASMTRDTEVYEDDENESDSEAELEVNASAGGGGAGGGDGGRGGEVNGNDSESRTAPTGEEA